MKHTSNKMNKHGIESELFCDRCENILHYCVCEDLNERMRDMTGKGGAVFSQWCKTCDRHYCRCECDQPDWWIRNEGELVRPYSQNIVVHGGPIDA